MELKIREIRKEKGLTQEQLARRMGISKACLCRWENWKDGSPIPTLRTLGRIADALDIRIKDLFEEKSRS